MYKVLIVDDEKEIREGLAAWTWEAVGLEVAGCFSHGLEALQFMEEHPVDVVITDIRMPFMDGIELMEVLNRKYPFTNVIILSGYNDFKYAQQAIRLGAKDYLLKPVLPSSLFHTCEQLVRMLDAKKQNEYRISILKRKEKLLTKLMRDDFLRRLFQTRMTQEEIELAGSEGEVLLDSDSYTVALFRMDRISLHLQTVPEKELKLLVFSLDNILSDLWDSKQKGYHLVNNHNAEFYLLCKQRDAQGHFSALHQQLVKFTGLFKSTFSLGVGPMVHEPREIRLSARAAEQALRSNEEEYSVSVYGDIPSDDTESLPVPEQKRPEVHMENGRNNIILMHAQQYILQNYHRSMTLKDVANHVSVSPGHLSALFKEAGGTYLGFLTSVRIKKALELLKDPALKVYEVMEMVGYSDPAYFSEVFKKYTGKTPNEYRGKSRLHQGN
jgi:two-component system response regulator YesN